MKIQPKLTRVAKVPAEASRRISVDRSPAFRDLVDATGPNTDSDGQLVLRNSDGREKLFGEDLSRVDWGELWCAGFYVCDALYGNCFDFFFDALFLKKAIETGPAVNVFHSPKFNADDHMRVAFLS